MESLEDLLLNANDTPIMIEKEFTGQCCVRGHHANQSKLEAKVDRELKAYLETRLVHL